MRRPRLRWRQGAQGRRYGSRRGSPTGTRYATAARPWAIRESSDQDGAPHAAAHGRSAPASLSAPRYRHKAAAPARAAAACRAAGASHCALQPLQCLQDLGSTAFGFLALLAFAIDDLFGRAFHEVRIAELGVDALDVGVD